MRCDAVRCYAEPSRAMSCGAVHGDVASCRAALYMQYRALLCGVVWCRVVPCGAVIAARVD